MFKSHLLWLLSLPSTLIILWESQYCFKIELCLKMERSSLLHLSSIHVSRNEFDNNRQWVCTCRVSSSVLIAFFFFQQCVWFPSGVKAALPGCPLSNCSGNWGTEKLSNLPKVTPLLRDRMGFQPRSIYFLSSWPLMHSVFCSDYLWCLLFWNRAVLPVVIRKLFQDSWESSLLPVLCVNKNISYFRKGGASM